jgi:hypothetical protein
MLSLYMAAYLIWGFVFLAAIFVAAVTIMEKRDKSRRLP